MLQAFYLSLGKNIYFVDVEGTKNVKQMISLLAITGQLKGQIDADPINGSERQEADVNKYMRSTDVNGVFRMFSW